MKLTRQQRHMAYMIMLAEVEVGGFYWICTIAKECFDVDLDNDLCFGNFKVMFPELYAKRKYKHNGAFLWDGSSERLVALKQCIEETADAWPK